MGLTRVRIVLRKNNRKCSDGYLKIRATTDRKSSFQTLGLKISEKHWNARSQEVRKSHPRSEELNKFIAHELKTYKQKKSIKSTEQGAEESLFDFFHKKIGSTINPGSKNVRQATLKKITLYCAEIGKDDLSFEDVTVDFVEHFYKYLRTQVSLNTAAHHIKVFRIIINSAVKSGLIAPFVIHPFSTVKARTIPPKFELLSPDQLHLLQTRFVETKDRYLNIYLFSLFAQGMRKSDALTLRWRNFSLESDELKLNHTVRKSLKNRTFVISDNVLFYLREILYKESPALKDKIDIVQKRISEHEVKLEVCTEYLDEFKPELEHGETNLLITLMKSGMTMEESKLYVLERILKLQQEIDYHSTCIEEEEQEIYDMCSSIIKQLSRDKPDQFVFHPFQGLDFSKFMNDDIEYTLADSRAKLYNYHLKKIGKECGITNLTPHSARHTYMHLIDSIGADLQTIQHMAGHSDPKQTIAYIHRLKAGNAKEFDQKLSANFSHLR